MNGTIPFVAEGVATMLLSVNSACIQHKVCEMVTSHSSAAHTLKLTTNSKQENSPNDGLYHTSISI